MKKIENLKEILFPLKESFTVTEVHQLAFYFFADCSWLWASCNKSVICWNKISVTRAGQVYGISFSRKYSMYTLSFLSYWIPDIFLTICKPNVLKYLEYWWFFTLMIQTNLEKLCLLSTMMRVILSMLCFNELRWQDFTAQYKLQD